MEKRIMTSGEFAYDCFMLAKLEQEMITLGYEEDEIEAYVGENAVYVNEYAN